MVDKLRKRRLTSLLITFLLFLLGVSLGMLIDKERISWSERMHADNELLYESSNIQYLLLSQLDDTESECPVLLTALEKNIVELGENLERLLNYEKDSIFRNEKAYQMQKRKYFLSNVKYWLLSSKVADVCPEYDAINILYFYSTENCPICPNQGVVLTYYKNIFQEKLLVFPIDIDLKKEEPVIDLLISRFGLTTYPTLIINNQKYEGVVYKEKLGRIICAEFTEDYPECAVYKEG
jgi:hypothetical protein